MPAKPNSVIAVNVMATICVLVAFAYDRLIERMCLDGHEGRSYPFRYSMIITVPGADASGGLFLMIHHLVFLDDKRLGKARLPIERLWGPAVPTEMLRDEAVAVWQDQLLAVDAEAKRVIGLLLAGNRIGSLL